MVQHHLNRKIKTCMTQIKTVVLEELDYDIIKRIQNLVNSFTDKNLKIGNKYIPVPISIIHNNVIFFVVNLKKYNSEVKIKMKQLKKLEESS
jgi:hypothetical protein